MPDASDRGDARPVTPVAILAAELDDICRAADLFAHLPTDVAERLLRARDLALGLDPYVESCTSAESSTLVALARRTRSHTWGERETAGGSVMVEREMLSGHVEGKLLQFLVRTSGATRVLEIGTFTGYSALAMAEALPDGGEVVTCEISPDVAAFARESFDRAPCGSKIRIETGAAGHTIAGLDATCRRGDEAPFDLVFIDADKAGYLQYLGALLDSAILRPGAVIVVDNTLLQGEPYLDESTRSVNGSAIARFNAAVAADERIEQVLLPIRDGITLIRRIDAS